MVNDLTDRHANRIGSILGGLRPLGEVRRCNLDPELSTSFDDSDDVPMQRFLTHRAEQ